MSEADLRKRLALAETVCVFMGWDAARWDTAGLTTHQAWSEWVDLVGGDYCSPRQHPDLDEARVHELVSERTRIRAETLAKIKKMGLGYE